MSDPWSGARVLAIDPGRGKCGVAALDAEGRLLYKTIVPAADLAGRVSQMLGAAPEAAVIIGAGTASRDLQAALRAARPGLALEVVAEQHSTERALERWRLVEPPRGWRHLLPRSLRFPPGPLDDFAAWILAEDFLRGH